MKIAGPLLLMLMAGCAALTLTPSDFSWPVESELTADRRGMVKEDRYHLSFSIKPLLFEELQDSVNVSGKTIRMIRDGDGFYYITGPKFKHVYVFEHSAGGLRKSGKIMVHESGLGNPALNQRGTHIQLLNGRDKPVLLTRGGLFTPPEQKGDAK